MNILPKKRWHVRNRDNIARVRKDEAAAIEEEKEKERRRCLAEQEAKIELMRKFTKQKYNISNEIESVVSSVSSSSDRLEHINFFSDLEKGVGGYTAKNKEHEEELKNEKEKYEKQIGYLTYLGQDTNEANRCVSWYDKPRSSLIHDNDEECDLKKKNKLDPVHLFKRVFNRHDLSNITKIADKSASKLAIQEKQKEKHRRSRCSSQSKYLDKKNKLQILREQRLKREQQEKLRVNELFMKKKSEVELPVYPESAKFVQKYNSQYNPHLARQNGSKVDV